MMTNEDWQLRYIVRDHLVIHLYSDSVFLAVTIKPTCVFILVTRLPVASSIRLVKSMKPEVLSIPKSLNIWLESQHRSRVHDILFY